MNEQNKFLESIIKALNDASIPYMISGSIGSSFHGQPRATNDADIVIDPTQKQLLGFIELLGPNCYISKDAAIQAIENNSMFNVIDIESGVKADLILRKKRPFSQREFARRMSAKFFAMDTYFVTPEDSILSKLEWSKGRLSDTQFKDALGVLVAQKDKLDFKYLKNWAKELGIGDTLQKLLEEADLQG